KDLLTHRSGLPRHDIMWYNGQFSRQEIFERLKYLEDSEDFRSVFQYQNLMFMTAGVVEAQVEGAPWEELVQSKIFKPLGMSSSNVSVAETQKSADYALPYEYKDPETLPEEVKKGAAPKAPEGEIKEMPFRNIDAVGPAGSINSNVTDMAKWVSMNLNEGKAGETTVVSKAQLEEIHAPAIVIRGGLFSELFTYPEAPYMMYGMGWFIQPYRGYRLLHHGGNIDGFSAMVAFLPDEKIGFVILSNLDGNLMVDSLMFEIVDRLLGLDPLDWNSRYKLKWTQIKQALQQSEKKEEVLKKTGTKPSHPMADFAGAYESGGYGRMEIALQGPGLKVTYGTLSSSLEHWHYDIFRATEDPLKGSKISFLTNLRGDIDRLSVALEAGIEETVFRYKPPASMNDPNFLRQFPGEYELLGLTISVALRADNRLTLTVPGQPEYELEPYRGTEFNLKDQPGFSVKFTMQQGKVTEAIFIQPNGVFTAKRK
ncbi:MAG TPA: serine hydrolase, partial [Acidobacteriota bacterium]